MIGPVIFTLAVAALSYWAGHCMKQVEGRDPKFTFYGPHQCDKCREAICRTSYEQGGLKFDYPIGPIYPNTRWEPHFCVGQPQAVNATGRPFNGAWAECKVCGCYSGIRRFIGCSCVCHV